MTADNLDSRLARMRAAISCEKGDRVPGKHIPEDDVIQWEERLIWREIH